MSTFSSTDGNQDAICSHLFSGDLLDLWYIFLTFSLVSRLVNINVHQRFALCTVIHFTFHAHHREPRVENITSYQHHSRDIRHTISQLTFFRAPDDCKKSSTVIDLTSSLMNGKEQRWGDRLPSKHHWGNIHLNSYSWLWLTGIFQKTSLLGKSMHGKRN